MQLDVLVLMNSKSQLIKILLNLEMEKLCEKENFDICPNISKLDLQFLNKDFRKKIF